MTKRFKDAQWEFKTALDGSIQSWEQVQCALLMDLRDELQALNRVIGCVNFLDIPRILRDIRTNTTPKAKAKRRPGKAVKHG